MDTTIVKTFAGVLDELSSRFGATGVHLWQEMVRYQIATVIADTVTFIIMALITAVLARWLWKRRAEEAVRDTRENYMIFMVICAACTVVFVILTLVSLNLMAVTLAAPEAATLKSLMP